MTYESFKNSKNKLQKIWENNENNTSEINNNLQKINTHFNSINFNKIINKISIPVSNNPDVLIGNIDSDVNEDGNQIFNGIARGTISIDLNNYPEWIINHINVLPIVNLVENVNNDTILSDIIISDGIIQNAKIDNIEFDQKSQYWFAKLIANNYVLKVYFFITVRKVISLTFPWFENLPFTIDLSLNIINPRIYEKTNIHKK